MLKMTWRINSAENIAKCDNCSELEAILLQVESKLSSVSDVLAEMQRTLSSGRAAISDQE